MKMDEQKAALNREAKTATREFLRAKPWPEKVRSIERMNAAKKVARESMRKAMAGKAEGAD